MQRALANIRSKFGVAVVQAEYTQLASYRPDILVEHDITFDLYRQVYEYEQTPGARWDWWRWRRFETKALASARRVVVMSPKDAAQTGRKDAVVIPNGVDLDRFRPSPEPEGRQLLFIGSFRHFPNVLAYRFLVEEVWPVLVRSFPGLRLTVVAGTQPQTYWREVTGARNIPAPEAVKLLEFVADVKPLYDACNVVVVPTPVSAGTNVKVLEAMAAQRAVVSTSCGCAGLGLVHGVSVWVADGAVGFQEGVARLLENGALRVSLAQAARRHAERYFSWAHLGALQRRLWSEVAPAPVRIRKAVARDCPEIARIQSASAEASHWIPESYFEHHCVVAELNGQTAGFVVWRETTPGEREILNLAVAPEWRRKGVGSQLLASVLDGSSAEWYLEVRESNRAARKLYERLGFTFAGRRPEYYTDSHESGIVLRFRSC
jgi:ribosomal protein S18 acetylase RimI-like enzyme